MQHAPRIPLTAEVAAVALAALLGLALAWQGPGPISRSVGSYVGGGLSGFYPPEQNPQRTYRWSAGQARLDFPGIGVADWQVTLVAASGTRPTGAPPLTIRIGDYPVLQAPAADP